MPAVHAKAQNESLTLTDWLPLCAEALTAAESFGAAAQRAVARRVAPGGKVDADPLEREQFAAHGFAWLATYVAALRESLHWAESLQAAGQLGKLERLLLRSEEHKSEFQSINRI